MKHYWINIDKNKKRQQFMEGQFTNLHLEHFRVSAYTPDDFDYMLNHKRPLTCKYPGCVTCEYEFACICSHLKAMQQALQSEDDWFVIMEDDAQLPFVIDYEALIKDAPKDAEIIQTLILYGNTITQLFNYYMHTKNVFIKWQYLLPSTGMYIISRKGAQRLVNLFYNQETKKYDFSKSPYQIVADVLLYETAKTYATTIPYAYPNPKMGSEIHPDHLSAQSNAVNTIKEVISKHKQHFPYIKKVVDITDP